MPIEIAVWLQKIKLCVRWTVKEHTALSWRSHIAEKVIFALLTLGLMRILKEILQCIGIYRFYVAEKIVNVPLVNLLWHNLFAACSVALIAKRVENFSTPHCCLMFSEPLCKKNNRECDE